MTYDILHRQGDCSLQTTLLQMTVFWHCNTSGEEVNRWTERQMVRAQHWRALSSHHSELVM